MDRRESLYNHAWENDFADYYCAMAPMGGPIGMLLYVYRHITRSNDTKRHKNGVGETWHDDSTEYLRLHLFWLSYRGASRIFRIYLNISRLND